MFERANSSLKKFRIDAFGSYSLFGRKDGIKEVFLSGFILLNESDHSKNNRIMFPTWRL